MTTVNGFGFGNTATEAIIAAFEMIPADQAS